MYTSFTKIQILDNQNVYIFIWQQQAINIPFEDDIVRK